MREIKFRAWDKKLKFMYPDAFEHPDYCFEDLLNDDIFEVMQFTGLKDKNGKEIYEGDIVKIPTNEKVFIVEWDTYFWKIITKDKMNNAGLGLKTTNIEVIGNIYENPELLTNK
jgi:uncharacterized phage protein (TIGR01671 family)